MDENRPLYSLTVEEFKELSMKIAQDLSLLNTPIPPREKPTSDVLFIEEVMLLTGYKKSTIHSKVSRREMPVLSYGRPLTFSKEEILNWMKSGKLTLAELRAEAIFKQNKK